jgi:hypothetical protein
VLGPVPAVGTGLPFRCVSDPGETRAGRSVSLRCRRPRSARVPDRTLTHHGPSSSAPVRGRPRASPDPRLSGPGWTRGAPCRRPGPTRRRAPCAAAMGRRSASAPARRPGGKGRAAPGQAAVDGGTINPREMGPPKLCRRRASSVGYHREAPAPSCRCPARWIEAEPSTDDPFFQPGADRNPGSTVIRHTMSSSAAAARSPKERPHAQGGRRCVLRPGPKMRGRLNSNPYQSRPDQRCRRARPGDPGRTNASLRFATSPTRSRSVVVASCPGRSTGRDGSAPHIGASIHDGRSDRVAARPPLVRWCSDSITRGAAQRSLSARSRALMIGFSR